MAYGDYELDDLRPGMHVKIPDQGWSWGEHLKEDRWFTIDCIDGFSIRLKEDKEAKRGLGYVVEWVSECMELDGCTFYPVSDVRSLFDL